MLAVLWVLCAVVIVASAAGAARGRSGATRVGRWATAVLFLGAGAAVNAAFLARGDDYETFADGSYLAFVTDTWRSLVVPRHELFIGALIAFELAVGLCVLLRGRLTRAAYLAAIAFHIGLLAFGWGFWLWSVPMITSFVVLARREGTVEHPRDDPRVALTPYLT